jgi:CheY-like chemotaxis protein
MNTSQTSPLSAVSHPDDAVFISLRRAAKNKWVELEKRRILIVEVLQALDLANTIIDLGAVVVGIATPVPAALAEISVKEFDCVTLDLNMDGFFTIGIAKGLRDMKIPYVLCTAYGHFVEEVGTTPVVHKPITQEALAEALVKAMRRLI